MPEAEEKKADSAGISSPEAVDVAELFARLSEEVRRVGPAYDAAAGSSMRLNARAALERLWPVSAERPYGGRAGLAGAPLRPVKVVLRRLMRWYVEPVFAEQRAFNDALLRLLDDLAAQVDRLEARVRELEAAQRP
jgi:hypothetical protein